MITKNSELFDDAAFVEMADVAAREDLALFSEHTLGFNNANHHREWYDILQDRVRTGREADWDSDLIPSDGEKNRLIALLAPRSHAKSTVFTVNYPLWCIGNDPNIRILIVSAAQTQSEAFLREIKSHMSLNSAYRRIFGDLFPADVLSADKWTNTEIIVNRTNPKLKDPTVAVTSAGGTILGRRADIILCDDILDEKNTKTLEQRQKIRDWFDSVLMPVLEPDGRLIVVGTAWNKEDLYHNILQQKIYDVRKRYKAVLDDDKKLVLWPERWSYAKLMQRKEQTGSLAFNKSYQNEAQSAEDSVFQIEWLQEAKRKGANRTFINTLNYATWDMGRMRIAMGVDLAISKNNTSDYTAMSVIAESLNGMKLPLYMSREKLSPAQTKEKIIALNARYKPDVVMVENNAYQESLRLDIADTTSIPIRGYTTGGEKYDPEIGINSLAIEFENGKWILPYSSQDPNTQQMVDILVGGLLDFPDGHTEDLVMSLWFANTGLRGLSSKQSTVRQASAASIFGR